MDVAGYTAQQRPQREQADGGREHPPSPKSIRHPAADRNEDREAQGVARQYRLYAQRSYFESIRHGRRRRVQNRRVQRFHKERNGDQPW